MRLQEAEEMPKISLPLQEAEGKIAGTYVNLYPPGIPLVIPGAVSYTHLDVYKRQVLERPAREGESPVSEN